MTDTGEQRMWWFETEPGDRGNLEAFYFESGVLRATEAEVEALLAIVQPSHFGVISIRPLDDQVKNLDEFAVVVGSALSSYHSIVESEPCAEDAPFLAAYEKDAYGEPESVEAE